MANGDYGATVEQFIAVHGVDHGPGAFCAAANVCFGPVVMNAESSFGSGDATTYEFTAVALDTGGIVDIYTQNFADSTPIGEAEAQVLHWMPLDTVAKPLVVDHNGGSCGIWNLTSKTLAQELSPLGDPTGVVGVEFEYIDANLNVTYNPNNVQDASLADLADDPTDTC